MSYKIMFIFAALTAFLPVSEAKTAKDDIYSIPVKTIDGKSTSLDTYRGKVLLIVNTASGCGYTPQYAGLEELNKTYRAKGLEVLGFPSNDFGGQEPGTEAEIKKFCELQYKTTFPLFAKVGVKENPHPLYAYLQKKSGEKVQWNFGKFLVGKKGEIRKYYPSKIKPQELTADIEAALKE